MPQEILGWAEVLSHLTKARDIYREVTWPPRTEPLDDMLMSTFNIDVHSERQLFYLMQAVAMYGPVMRGEALGTNSDESFLLSRTVEQAWAGLLVELSEFMPEGIERSVVALRAVDKGEPNPTSFIWRAVSPTPLQYQRYRRLHGEGNPIGIIRLSGSQMDGITAFMSMAACVLIAVSAIHVLPDRVPDQAVQDLSVVAIVTTFLTLPEPWQRQ